MPKIRTHKGAAKRFKMTGTGKIKRNRAYKSHLLTGKPAKRMKRLRQPTLVSDKEYGTIKRLLPYL